MRKQRRDRKRRSICRMNAHGAMVVVDQVSAAEAFVRKAYSVDEYIRAKGIDTRRGLLVDKKKLSQLRPLKKELELIDRKLDGLYDRQENVPVVLGKVVGSSKDFPYVEVRTTVQMDEPKEADEISKQIWIREKRREQVESLITEIEQFIAEIPDSRDRQIFELRYIEGLTMKKVGERVGYSKGRVSQIISGYLKD